MKITPKIKSFLACDDSNFEKYQQLIQLLPKGKRLVEPFVGAGQVFLNTNYEAYLLADSNQDIINVFELLATYKQEFIERARQYFPANTKVVHELQPQSATETRIKRGCLFLYLNCRDKAHLPEQEMQAFLAKLTSCQVTFLVADFQQTLAMTSFGDVVYCDLPKITVNTATYFSDKRPEFSWGDHFRLFNSFRELELRGIPVLFASNNLKSKVLVEKFITMKD